MAEQTSRRDFVAEPLAGLLERFSQLAVTSFEPRLSGLSIRAVGSACLTFRPTAELDAPPRLASFHPLLHPLGQGGLLPISKPARRAIARQTTTPPVW